MTEKRVRAKHTGQVSMLEPLQLRVFGCGDCFCKSCLYWWSGRCPQGSCWDDWRAVNLPYDRSHPSEVRKEWSDWDKPGEQAHWCRGGSFYPSYACPDYRELKRRPLVRSCFGENITVWQDGYIECGLVSMVGCEECIRRYGKEGAE